MPPAAERWLSVVGWEGSYEVSDHGRVRGVDRIVIGSRGQQIRLRGKLRTPSLNKEGPDGRWKLQLRSPDRLEAWFVHALVLTAFVGPRPPGKVSRHLDGNRDNNTLGNLAWGTPSENMTDRVFHGRSPQASKVRCSHGHLFSGPNLILRKSDGIRACRACQRGRTRVHDAWRRRGETLDFLAEATAAYHHLMGADA